MLSADTTYLRIVEGQDEFDDELEDEELDEDEFDEDDFDEEGDFEDDDFTAAVPEQGLAKSQVSSWRKIRRGL